MKTCNFLPLAAAALLIGCSPATPDEKLNKTLPGLSLEETLPKVVANQYCKPDMDSELLYGLGNMLIDEDEERYGVGRVLLASKEVQMARSCLVMAAPKYTRSLCFLAGIVGTRPNNYDKREAFNYLAYAASKNEACAEWGLYDIYTVGKLGEEPDKDLGMRWLERSALHGEPDAKQDMLNLSSEQGDMPVAYAWARVLEDAEKIDALKEKMNPREIAEGDQHHNQLLSRLTRQDDLRQALRKEQIALHSADVYMNHPEAFEGMSPVQRRELMANVVDTVNLSPDFSSRRQLYAYTLIARRAASNAPYVDLWQNPALRALLMDRKLSVEDTVAKALAILNKGDR